MTLFQPTWTDERVELLKQLWGRGLSATQIAADIGGTRNSVIGKIHRLGLQRNKDASQLSNRLANKLHASSAGRKFRWTEDRDAQLAELFSAGAFDAEIASALGTTAHSVLHRRKAIRLLREPTGGFKAAKPPKVAKPKFFLAGNGTVIQRSEALPPHATVVAQAWAPLPGVSPILREHAADRHCKWPITVDGDELAWCCSAMATEGPYCKAHKRKSISVNQPDDVTKAQKKRAKEQSHASVFFRGFAAWPGTPSNAKCVKIPLKSRMSQCYLRANHGKLRACRFCRDSYQSPCGSTIPIPAIKSRRRASC